MADLKILHTADLHLGTTFRDLPQSTSKSQERIKDYLIQLERIRDEAINGEYDFLIIAGDIFSNIRPDSYLFDEFAKLVRSLTKEGIKVVAIAGNHDQPRLDGSEPYLKAFYDVGAPDFYFFRKPSSICLEGKRSKKNVRFICLPYLAWQTLDPVQYTNMIQETVKRLKAENKTYDYTVVVAHFYIEGAKAGAEHRLITFGDPPLPKTLFDWA
ncbi:MAG: metallophosphoesterase, partial [Nitrososphaerota archaeon]